MTLLVTIMDSVLMAFAANKTMRRAVQLLTEKNLV
jgi:hypothetical protein